MASKFECVARGSDAVDNAFPKLDDTRVQFMYIKFPVGSGTFKRNKFLYVHFVGPKCGIVKRGKWNAELGNILSLFGSPTGIEVDNREVLNFGYLVSQMKKVFVADDGSFSIDKLQEEYNRRIAEEAAKSAVASNLSSNSANEPTSPIRKRKLAVELGLTCDSVLKAIREDMGPINWAVFQPDPKKLTFIEGGSGGVFEMFEHLPDDKVVFGLLRMAFGTGRFRRTKHIFFQFIGDSVGPVAKGKANVLNSDMAALLTPHQADIRLMGKSDLTPEGIIEKVKSVFTVDNIESPAGEGKATKKAALTAEEYIQSLLEEQQRASKFYNEPEVIDHVSAVTTVGFDVAETIREIQKEEGGFAWGIFQVKN